MKMELREIELELREMKMVLREMKMKLRIFEPSEPSYLNKGFLSYFYCYCYFKYNEHFRTINHYFKSDRYLTV